MKKAFILFVVLLATVSFAEKGDMKVGPHVGFWLPIGDWGDMFTLSPRFGAKYLYELNDKLDIEGNAAFGLMQMKNDDLWDDYSYSIIEIAGGVRYGVKEDMHAGGGLSLNMFRFKYESPYIGDISDSSSEIGLFGSFGMVFPMKSFDLDPQVKLHLIEGDIMFSLDVGFNFPIGGN